MRPFQKNEIHISKCVAIVNSVSSNLVVVADLVIKTKEANGGEGTKRARKRRCIGTEEEGKEAVELSVSFSAQFA